MDIDMTALKAMERDKEIGMEVLIHALEDALLNAYEKTPGAIRGARVELDRKTGRVTVLAPELDEEGETDRRVRRHPGGFRTGGRRHRPPGDLPAAAGGRGRAEVRPLPGGRGRHRGRRRPAGSRLPDGPGRPGRDRGDHAARPSRCPVRTTPTASGCGSTWSRFGSDLRGPQVVVSRTHPGLVAKLFRLEVPEIEHGIVEIKAIAREAGHRTKIAVVSHNSRRLRQGGLHRADGPAGAGGHARTERGEDRHHRLLRRTRPSFVAQALSPAKVSSVTVTDPAARAARVIVPDYQLSLAIGREGQNARLAARLTGWRIDIRSDTAPPIRRPEPP